jgi:hypothetical protein
MSYDEKCLELAEHFLPDPEGKQREQLAQHIQDSIEDWFQNTRKLKQ